METAHPCLVFVIFILAVFGLSTAIAVLKIGRMLFGQGYCSKEGCSAPGHPKELRRFLGRLPVIGDLFYCPSCLAAWIGMGISRIAVSPSSVAAPMPWWAAMVLDGLAACGAVWLLHLLAERLSHGLPNI